MRSERSFDLRSAGLYEGSLAALIRKFRGEFEEYIKRTNPSGYSVTEPAPALAVLAGAH